MEPMKIPDSKATILIVDDAATNIALLSNLLQDTYKIKVAKNGPKALEIARSQEKPDLILLDVEMPGMDGYEVCKKLKSSSQTNNIPIIFVTARNDVKDEEYGLNLGAVDYISKPFHPTIVNIRVKNHIALKLKSDWLEELSMIDGLTHIPNRRYFDETFEKKYKETLRDKKTFAVLMIDVDYFKPYNDHYGHGKGDECLIHIAGSLQNTLQRPNDMVFRYGGEEFVVLLQDIDREGVRKVAENLLASVHSLNITHEYSSLQPYVTISVGIAFKDHDCTIGKEALIKMADDALYDAKEHGRDRYVEHFTE